MSTGRLIFVAMLDKAVRGLVEEAIIACGLATRLGDAMFPVENWHQSLSVRFEDTLKNRKKLTRAGNRVVASAFRMTFNRFSGEIDDPMGIHWAIRAIGHPKGLLDLIGTIQAAIREEGLSCAGGHTAHVTISYRAPEILKTSYIRPIDWVVNEFCLVRGGGQPYRYDILKRWPLPIGTPPASPQLSLI